jgi:hypothetical protein
MKKEAPKLRVINGGKKEPKVILSKELILVLWVCLTYLAILSWCLYVN